MSYDDFPYSTVRNDHFKPITDLNVVCVAGSFLSFHEYRKKALDLLP